MKPKESLAYFQSQQDMMLEDLLRWVAIESPTTDKESVDILGHEVAGKLADIGMSIEIDTQRAIGNHVIARWGNLEPKVLLIGHLDTVWQLGTLEKMPARVEGDKAYGPGIFDMKGGIVIALYALRFLREHGFQHANLTFLLTSDEEEGSDSSRELIEKEAAGAQYAFILEPAGPNNGLKTKRRGVGRYNITAHGKAAHAGVEPEKGVSAIEELAHQILEVQSWNRVQAGISANVGLIHGGSRTNVIPDHAFAAVDVRCNTPQDMKWLEERFRSLAARNPNATLTVDGGIERPPLVRSEKVLSLFHEVREITEAFHYPVTEYWTGGGSDGNFTAAMGVATLDGLGVEGEGAHALHEQIIVSSLPKRANLLYHLLRKKLSSQS